jgi:hypothetical protein
MWWEAEASPVTLCFANRVASLNGLAVCHQLWVKLAHRGCDEFDALGQGAGSDFFAVLEYVVHGVAPVVVNDLGIERFDCNVHNYFASLSQLFLLTLHSGHARQEG